MNYRKAQVVRREGVQKTILSLRLAVSRLAPYEMNL
jgi:hypothetical protein